MFLDDIAGMSFYRKARWSKVRVTVHSGREVVFEKDQVTVYPCRSAYTADNETIEGIRSSLEEIKENENAEDEEESRETFSARRLMTISLTRQRANRRSRDQNMSSVNHSLKKSPTKSHI